MRVKSEVKKSRKIFTQNHPKSHLQRCVPGSLLSAYHISYKGLLVVAMMMLVPGSDPTSWDGEVNGATSDLKY